LYGVKKLKVSKLTDSGKGSTDEEALQSLNIPEMDGLLRIRKLKKMRDTYLHNFISESVDGFIHPFFNLHIATTYRSSSDSPNFQNVPVRDAEAKKIIRSCLVPREGHQLVEIDFSGIEVCIAACYHKDPTMIKYIKDPTSDMHADMAKQIFMFKAFDKKQPELKTLRQGAKNGFVFPQFYGDYYGNNALGLSKWAKLPTEGRYKKEDGIALPGGLHLGEHMMDNGIKSFKDFLNHLQRIEEHFWGTRFPVYASWKRKWFKAYQEKGYFDTLTGFRCRGIMGKNDATNYPVQGSAFHCLLWSFIQMDRIIRKNNWRSRLIGQIHDSMLFDVHPDELIDLLKAVKRVCEQRLVNHWKWIIVPLTIEIEMCEVDKSWYDKKPVSDSILKDLV
jgi:DNA polymerase-1